MTRLGKTVLALAAAAAVGYALVVSLFPSWSWRQKLTVAVETAEGEKSGSAVVEVGWSVDTFNPGNPGRAHDRLRGEATIVDLGGGKYLFALLGGAEGLAQYVLLDKAMLNTSMAERGSALQQVGLSGEAPSTLYPLLVTFTDIADPKTVKRVDPDDLDAAFGLCPDGTGLNDAEAPWRAAGLIWRRWARWQASGLTLDAYKAKYEGRVLPEWIEALDRMITPRDRSTDCRRLKAMTLTITDEKVTEGRVEAVFTKAFFERWRDIHKEAIARGFNDPYFKTLLANLMRGDFQRKVK
ncbi:MAG: hypothetical protein IPL47_14490 [Phyllobacteriaceae bacterium]|nr:hypothetical protein [Phyllobacteriaceae bacterium]